MWAADLQRVDEETSRVTLKSPARALSFGEVFELWRGSAEFRDYFTQLIVDSVFEAFFYEMPPVTKRTLERAFEFVLVQAPSLERLQPAPAPFKSHFESRGSADVLVFPNLGGDAILVVPAPVADPSSYTHLGRFLREAPKAQVNTFWRCVGVAMHERICGSPTWLSTAGLGVSWLHLRLDSRPKYYRHEPYKTG